ncbi:DUF917 domain-containing protein [Microbacterium esteraromaticum]|nr:DUF917 domain-containing protein [Microbacterium esteraromaticum]
MLLAREDLTALARGYALLGSGGGGSTTMLELMLGRAGQWPIEIVDTDGLAPETPCLGVAFVGSTMLLAERLPGAEPFAPLIAAVERWLGHPVPAVCSLEGGGLNGLTPLMLAGSHTIVDADCTGRAVPGLDQMSLFVDRVPGIVVACDTGQDGVALIEAGRGIDVERVVRAAIIQAGGVGCAVFAGFTVGDLREHAIAGHLSHALDLGRAFVATAGQSIDGLADALGARLVAQGRILSVSSHADDPHVSAVEITARNGAVHRVITRSETLAVLTDGVVVAAAPTIIVVIDAISRDILEVTDLSLARNVAVLAIPAPAWWTAEPGREERVRPSAYGLAELDAA